MVSNDCILLFLKKGDLGITENYRGITLTAITVKIHNALLLNCIWPEVYKILKENQNGFSRNRSATFQILTVRYRRNTCKKYRGNTLVCRFHGSIEFHAHRKDGAIWAYGYLKETITAIIILYKDMKSIVRSPNSNTDYFDIVVGILQWDRLVPFLFIIYLHYLLRTSTEIMDKNGFRLKMQEGDDIL